MWSTDLVFSVREEHLDVALLEPTWNQTSIVYSNKMSLMTLTSSQQQLEFGEEILSTDITTRMV